MAFSQTVLYICSTVPIFHSFNSRSLSPYTVSWIWRERSISPWSRGAKVVGRMRIVGMHEVKESDLGSSGSQIMAPKICFGGGHSGQERSWFHHWHRCPPWRRFLGLLSTQAEAVPASDIITRLPLCSLTSWLLASVYPPILLQTQALHRTGQGSVGWLSEYDDADLAFISIVDHYAELWSTQGRCWEVLDTILAFRRACHLTAFLNAKFLLSSNT